MTFVVCVRSYVCVCCVPFIRWDDDVCVCVMLDVVVHRGNVVSAIVRLHCLRKSRFLVAWPIPRELGESLVNDVYSGDGGVRERLRVFLTAPESTQWGRRVTLVGRDDVVRCFVSPTYQESNWIANVAL